MTVDQNDDHGDPGPPLKGQTCLEAVLEPNDGNTTIGRKNRPINHAKPTNTANRHSTTANNDNNINNTNGHNNTNTNTTSNTNQHQLPRDLLNEKPFVNGRANNHSSTNTQSGHHNINDNNNNHNNTNITKPLSSTPSSLALATINQQQHPINPTPTSNIHSMEFLETYNARFQLPISYRQHTHFIPSEQLLKTHPETLTMWLTQSKETIHEHRKAIFKGTSQELIMRFFPVILS
jgi:hypothetical protein